MRKIYLISGWKHKIHLAKELILHEGCHKHEYPINKSIYDKLKFIKHNRYLDYVNQEWVLYIDWFEYCYFEGGIKCVKEVRLDSFADVYNVICDESVVDIDKIRLLQWWNDEAEQG